MLQGDSNGPKFSFNNAESAAPHVIVHSTTEPCSLLFQTCHFSEELVWINQKLSFQCWLTVYIHPNVYNSVRSYLEVGVAYYGKEAAGLKKGKRRWEENGIPNTYYTRNVEQNIRAIGLYRVCVCIIIFFFKKKRSSSIMLRLKRLFPFYICGLCQAAAAGGLETPVMRWPPSFTTQCYFYPLRDDDARALYGNFSHHSTWLCNRSSIDPVTSWNYSQTSSSCTLIQYCPQRRHVLVYVINGVDMSPITQKSSSYYSHGLLFGPPSHGHGYATMTLSEKGVADAFCLPPICVIWIGKIFMLFITSKVSFFLIMVLKIYYVHLASLTSLIFFFQFNAQYFWQCFSAFWSFWVVRDA